MELRNDDMIAIARTAVIAVLTGGGGAAIVNAVLNRKKTKVDITVSITQAAQEIIDSLRSELTETRNELQRTREDFATIRREYDELKTQLDKYIAKYQHIDE